jgi:hypothetical protein
MVLSRSPILSHWSCGSTIERHHGITSTPIVFMMPLRTAAPVGRIAGQHRTNCKLIMRHDLNSSVRVKGIEALQILIKWTLSRTVKPAVPTLERMAKELPKSKREMRTKNNPKQPPLREAARTSPRLFSLLCRLRGSSRLLHRDLLVLVGGDATKD